MRIGIAYFDTLDLQNDHLHLEIRSTQLQIEK